MSTPTNPPDPARQSAEERARDHAASLSYEVRSGSGPGDKWGPATSYVDSAAVAKALAAAHAEGRRAGIEEAAGVAEASCRCKFTIWGDYNRCAPECRAADVADDIRTLARSAPPTNAVQVVLGKWPGDETEADLLAALKAQEPGEVVEVKAPAAAFAPALRSALSAWLESYRSRDRARDKATINVDDAMPFVERAMAGVFAETENAVEELAVLIADHASPIQYMDEAEGAARAVLRWARERVRSHG